MRFMSFILSNLVLHIPGANQLSCYVCWSGMMDTMRILRVNEAGPWFNIKMSSYQYRKSHCGDKMVVRSSYLHNGISYTGKVTSLYWIGAQVSMSWIIITFHNMWDIISHSCHKQGILASKSSYAIYNMSTGIIKACQQHMGPPNDMSTRHRHICVPLMQTRHWHNDEFHILNVSDEYTRARKANARGIRILCELNNTSGIENDYIFL